MIPCGNPLFYDHLRGWISFGIPRYLINRKTKQQYKYSRNNKVGSLIQKPFISHETLEKKSVPKKKTT